MEHLIERIAAHFKTEVDALKLEPIRHGSQQKHNVCRLKLGSMNYPAQTARHHHTGC